MSMVIIFENATWVPYSLEYEKSQSMIFHMTPEQGHYTLKLI